MRITSLHAKNFRCFQEFRLDLAPGFNLLIGTNGAGKTAVLDALKIGLGGFFQGFPGGKTYGFASTDMRMEPGPEADQLLDMQPRPPTELSWIGQLAGQTIRWNRELHTEKGRTTKGGVKRLRKQAEELADQMSRHEKVDLPVFAYFGTERLWLSKRHGNSPRLDRRRLTRKLGYLDCLERESSWLEMRNWLSAMTVGRELAQKKGMAAADSAQDLVSAIEAAVCSLVPGTKGLLYFLGDLYLQRQEQGLWGWYAWDMLSDGVRSLALLASQIAWRAATLNPHQGASAALLAEGVVLIDEVCLGLHPTWQRQVIAALVQAFPRLQFVATTHSPQVLGSAEQARIILLQPGGAQVLSGLYGKDSNTILAIQGGQARDEPVQQALSAVEKLIDNDALDTAKEQLKVLTVMLGADDPAVVRLDTLLRFLTPEPLRAPGNAKGPAKG